MAITTTYSWNTGASSFLNNGITAGNQLGPAAAANAARTAYLGAWTTPATTFDAEGRVIEITNGTTGTPLIDEFRINDVLPSIQFDPSAAGLTNGNFIVAFTDANTDPGGNILARLVSANGTPLGTDIVIDTGGNDDTAPSVASLADGGFVVAWYRFGGGDFDVRARVFDADGTDRAGLIPVTGSLDAELVPAVAGLAGGNLVVVYENATTSEVFFRRYTAAGAAIDGAPVLIDTTGSINTDIHTVALADGGFAVAYADNGWSISGTEITFRIFNADGTTRTSFIRANDAALGGIEFFNQNLPSITTLGNGMIVVSWLDAISTESFTQVFDAAGNPIGTNQGFNASVVEHEVVGLSGGTLADVRQSTLEEGTGTGDSIRTTVREFTRTFTSDGADDTLTGINDGLSEVFNGNGGDDTVVFSQNFNDYMVKDFGSKIVVTGPDGTDTLSSVEHLKFDDITLTPVDDGNPLFDELFYLSRNPDVFQAGVNAFDHFNTFGRHEGRDPNPFFDTSAYLAFNRDVAASGVNPLDHFHQSGWHEGRDPGPNFDTTLYLIHNPDVAAAGVDPLAHFLQFGFVEGRQAYQAIGTSIVGGFDAEFYLFHNPDVAAAGVDPLEHFNIFGRHEGRNPNAWFDTAGYLARYADVAAAGVNPLQHYQLFGWQEGRDPAASFDTLGYLAANPDVAAAGVNPLDHFLQFGIYEGRVAVNDGVFD